MDGSVEVRVPEGTQPGQKLRLKGQGIEGQGGKVGDHYVEIEVKIPRKLNDEQKELLKKFNRTLAGAGK
jgi:molecular chaperone DnaJ